MMSEGETTRRATHIRHEYGEKRDRHTLTGGVSMKRHINFLLMVLNKRRKEGLPHDQKSLGRRRGGQERSTSSRLPTYFLFSDHHKNPDDDVDDYDEVAVCCKE